MVVYCVNTDFQPEEDNSPSIRGGFYLSCVYTVSNVIHCPKLKTLAQPRKVLNFSLVLLKKIRAFFSTAKGTKTSTEFSQLSWFWVGFPIFCLLFHFSFRFLHLCLSMKLRKSLISIDFFVSMGSHQPNLIKLVIYTRM